MLTVPEGVADWVRPPVAARAAAAGATAAAVAPVLAGDGAELRAMQGTAAGAAAAGVARAAACGTAGQSEVGAAAATAAAAAAAAAVAAAVGSGDVAARPRAPGVCQGQGQGCARVPAAEMCVMTRNRSPSGSPVKRRSMLANSPADRGASAPGTLSGLSIKLQLLGESSCDDPDRCQFHQACMVWPMALAN